MTAAVGAAVQTLAVDKAHSEATFQVRHLVTKVRGASPTSPARYKTGWPVRWEMVEDRLMLCEDTASEYARLTALGLAQGVPAPRERTPR